MKLIKLFFWGFILVSLFPVTAGCKTGKLKIIMIISAWDSIVTARAVREISALPDTGNLCRLEFYTDSEVRGNRIKKEDINTADIILVDFMKREFDDFLSTTLENKKIDVYSLRCSYLAAKLKKIGITPDIRGEMYYQPPTGLPLNSGNDRIRVFRPFARPGRSVFRNKTAGLNPPWSVVKQPCASRG